MKKPNLKILKTTIAVILPGCIAIAANAQKLPTIQKTSMREPANIKINGKATEWNNKFQAFNKVTDIFYTLANDDTQLYLTIQATDPTIITKIVQGGVTFTINSEGKKNDKDGVAITFPAYDKNNKPFHVMMSNRPGATKDTLQNRMLTDSFMNVLNAQLADHLKIIEVDGVKAVADNIISIYNEEGIMAVSRFDNKIFYTCEIVIPLKYLGFIPIVTGDKQSKFSYNIKLNGIVPKGASVMDGASFGRPDLKILTYTDTDGKSIQMDGTMPENLILAYPTDFWGEYTLAKK